MANDLNLDQYPLGSVLFSDSESFIRDLTEEDESVMVGGKRSRSNSNSDKKRRKRKKRRRRKNKRRSRSNSRT
jgi:hypothetical protein